jgi:hypothetical protein
MSNYFVVPGVFHSNYIFNPFLSQLRRADVMSASPILSHPFLGHDDIIIKISMEKVLEPRVLDTRMSGCEGGIREP